MTALPQRDDRLAELAGDLAACVAGLEPEKLGALLAGMRRVAADCRLSAARRAIAGVEAAAVARYQSTGESCVEDMLAVCRVVARAQSDPGFDPMHALFTVGGS